MKSENTDSNVYCPITPAVPTDTCAILNHMLRLGRKARTELASSGQDVLIPRGVATMFLRSLKVRDPSLILHGRRIAAISRGISEMFGWEAQQRAELEVAALIHDLGKIGVPDHIIKKPGKLSSEEYDFVSLYHYAATALMQSLHVKTSLVATLSQLHHNFDGSGAANEDAATSGELPLGPRILAVADAYDSLSSAKSYRRGMSHDEVIKILTEQSGSRYDGNVISALNRWFQADGSVLFSMADPIDHHSSPVEMDQDERNEVVVLAQVLNVLYQFQSLYDGYFILDADQNYCVWSDGMTQLTGRDVTDVMGRNWRPSDVQLSPINQADGPVTEDTVQQVFKNSRPQFTSRLCETPTLPQMSLDVYTLPVLDGSKVNGVVQLFRSKAGVRRQTREYVELKLAATRDALTGVANRGQLETQLRHLLDDFHNHEGARFLSVIFLDVDKFKNINDTHGHKAGDQVLVDLTRLLQHETYSGEVIARYGGEEFVVLCPDADLETAVRRAERLRTAVAKSSVGGISGLTVTSSFGVATAHLGDTVQTLLERADACLYRAKETGRNRTCWEDQDQGDEVSEGPVEEKESRLTEVNGVLLFSQEIEMSTSLELTAMKLNAFIDATDDVKVKTQEHGQLKLQMGSVGFRRRWGTTPDRQAVEMDIHFETTRETRDSGKATTRRSIAVAIVPVGKVPDSATFELRCLQIMMQLRSYLLAT